MISPCAALLASLFLSAEEIESFESAPQGPSAQVFGSAKAQLGADTRQESAPGDELAENVVDLKTRARLAADVKLSDRVRLFLEGRALWRGSAQRGLQGARATFEPRLGEAFVDLYASKVDLRFGQQLVSFGANAAFAPADALNPRDLREGLLSDAEEGRLPAWAIRAMGEIGKVSFTAAYFPFFTPHRYVVFGQDEALVQPALGVRIPSRPDPSVEDELQPHLLETQRPKAFPHLGDLGIRAVTPAGPVKLGASWVWMTEKLPQVRLDPELTALLAAQARGKVDPDLGLSVQNRLAAGEELYSGRYQRTQLFSAEASTLLGSTQLDLDLSYSPRQTFFDELSPVSKASWTWVLGVSQAEDSPLLYSLTYVGLAIPGLKADELLLILEPTTAQGAARVGWVHLLVGVLGYTLWKGQLELSLRGGFEPVQRSFALAPKVSYKGMDRLTLWLAAEFNQGRAYSIFGYQGRNDQLVAGAEVTLF